MKNALLGLVMLAALGACEISWQQDRQTRDGLNVHRPATYSARGGTIQRRVCRITWEPGAKETCVVYRWDPENSIWYTTGTTYPYYGLTQHLEPEHIGWPTTREAGEDVQGESRAPAPTSDPGSDDAGHTPHHP